MTKERRTNASSVDTSTVTDSLGHIVRLLRTDPAWDRGIRNLADLKRSHLSEAEAEASKYAAKYEGCRGAMIVDVVASRQRRYHTRVMPIVNKWKATNREHTIAWLAGHRPDPAEFGLSVAEADTISAVAQNFNEFALTEKACESDDELCLMWADRYGCFELAPRLDPVVGSVKGIGLALWSYTRMRSGADTIKVDSRVRGALRDLGFAVPADDRAVFIIAKSVAQELHISHLVLDQLLWQLNENRPLRDTRRAIRKGSDG